MTGTCKFETKTQKLKLSIIHFEKHFLLITSNSKLHFCIMDTNCGMMIFLILIKYHMRHLYAQPKYKNGLFSLNL